LNLVPSAVSQGPSRARSRTVASTDGPFFAVLSVVMPAHNEAAYLETAVREVHEGLRARGIDFELLVVENGSTDDTPEIARRLAGSYRGVRVSQLPAANYGAALREGLMSSRGEFVVTFDVDYYELGFVDQALALLDSSEEAPVVVVASKRATGSRDERPWPRRFVTAIFGWLLRIGFSLSVSETHGMKMMRREPVEDIARRCRFASDLFDTELVIRAERVGLGIAELPARTEERRPSRTSIWRRVPRTLVGLVNLWITLWREVRRRR
jgi:glycosyltransferase involved in cell wall biosynthesis